MRFCVKHLSFARLTLARLTLARLTLARLTLARPTIARLILAGLILAGFILAGCGRNEALDYGFTIKNVAIGRAYQSLNIDLKQELQLSQQAREALEHGVSLYIKLELELQSDINMIVVRSDSRRFQLRYLPLSERFQLSEEESGKMRTFSRLRHLLAAIDDLNILMSTGPLPPGNYELRTRISLDESRLPTPMQLPALFSSQWQHDSEWSVWPFEISA